jgi:PEGA domain
MEVRDVIHSLLQRSARAAVFVGTLACLGGLLSSAAHADDRAVAVIVQSPVQSPVDATQRAVVAKAIEQVILQDAHWTVAAALDDNLARVVADCGKAAHPWACVTPVLQGKNLARIVAVTLEGSRPKGKPAALWLTARLMTAETGAASLTTRYCEPCTDPALAALAREAAKELIDTSTSRAGTTLLRVRTTPTGAIINLDTQMMGASNQLIPTSPGAHDLYLQLSGYQAELRHVVAQEGKTVDVDVTFQPVAAGTGTAPVLPPKTVEFEDPVLPGWAAPTMIGAGAVAVGIGSWLAFTASGPPPGGTLPESAQQDRHKYNTSVGGIILAGAGALVAGAGLYLWRWPPTRTRVSSSAAAVALVPGGLAATFVRSF